MTLDSQQDGLRLGRKEVCVAEELLGEIHVIFLILRNINDCLLIMLLDIVIKRKGPLAITGIYLGNREFLSLLFFHLLQSHNLLISLINSQPRPLVQTDHILKLWQRRHIPKFEIRRRPKNDRCTMRIVIRSLNILGLGILIRRVNFFDI